MKSGDLISAIPRKITPPCLVPIRKITQSFTLKYSQGIVWRNKFTSVTPENSWGINCVILEGPNGISQILSHLPQGPKEQEWPRQTKPKKGQVMKFSQGHSRAKFNVNRACFPKEKHQNSQKMGEIHELFVLALSLIWFAGATPEKIAKNQSRLKFSISLDKLNLARHFQSRPSEFPAKIGVWWAARLNISISLDS